jgi:hypothetical protein
MDTHRFLAGAQRCVDCGTLQANVGQTACPGPPHGTEILRPEPARREYAANDADAISTRLQELQAERDVAMNTPSKD